MIILPTSANPFHNGHLGMILHAQKTLIPPTNNTKSVVLISVNNADKGVITEDEYLKRAKTVDSNHHLLVYPNNLSKLIDIPFNEHIIKLTRDYYYTKYVLIGVDTLSRFCDMKYYSNENEFRYGVSRLLRHNYRLIVNKRNNVCCNDIATPVYVKPLLIPINDFESPVSSTSIRKLTH